MGINKKGEKEMKTDSFTGNASKEVLAAESSQKVLVFTCPECGGHHLDHWIADMWLSINIKGVTEEGRISWDYYSEEAGSGEIMYVCGDCDFQIPYGEVQDCNFDEDMDDEYCVVVWIHQHCHDYVDRPEDEQGDDSADRQGRLLTFTCPACGTHEFFVARDHVSEVTPIEYLSEEDELEYGRMKYVGGERVFGCLACDYQFEIDDSLEEGKALAKWLLENCNQS
jgi:predicted RNA-binding Zn-ribbon protein involved in translation (DUF1610 family)